MTIYQGVTQTLSVNPPGTLTLATPIGAASPDGVRITNSSGYAFSVTGVNDSVVTNPILPAYTQMVYSFNYLQGNIKLTSSITISPAPQGSQYVYSEFSDNAMQDFGGTQYPYTLTTQALTAAISSSVTVGSQLTTLYNTGSASLNWGVGPSQQNLGPFTPTTLDRTLYFVFLGGSVLTNPMTLTVTVLNEGTPAYLLPIDLTAAGGWVGGNAPPFIVEVPVYGVLYAGSTYAIALTNPAGNAACAFTFGILSTAALPQVAPVAFDQPAAATASNVASTLIPAPPVGYVNRVGTLSFSNQSAALLVQVRGATSLTSYFNSEIPAAGTPTAAAPFDAQVVEALQVLTSAGTVGVASYYRTLPKIGAA